MPKNPTERSKPNTNPRAINWAKWWHVEHLRIWEAIALSLEIDPDSVKHRCYGGIGEWYIDESREFRDRLFVACRNLGSKEVALSPDARVDRLEVLRLASSVKWELPARLEVLAFDPEKDVQLRDMREALVELNARGESATARAVAAESGYDRNSHAFKLRWQRLKQ